MCLGVLLYHYLVVYVSNFAVEIIPGKETSNAVARGSQIVKIRPHLILNLLIFIIRGVNYGKLAGPPYANTVANSKLTNK